MKLPTRSQVGLVLLLTGLFGTACISGCRGDWMPAFGYTAGAALTFFCIALLGRNVDSD